MQIIPISGTSLSPNRDYLGYSSKQENLFNHCEWFNGETYFYFKKNDVLNFNKYYCNLIDGRQFPISQVIAHEERIDGFSLFEEPTIYKKTEIYKPTFTQVKATIFKSNGKYLFRFDSKGMLYFTLSTWYRLNSLTDIINNFNNDFQKKHKIECDIKDSIQCIFIIFNIKDIRIIRHFKKELNNELLKKYTENINKQRQYEEAIYNEEQKYQKSIEIKQKYDTIKPLLLKQKEDVRVKNEEWQNKCFEEFIKLITR